MVRHFMFARRAEVLSVALADPFFLQEEWEEMTDLQKTVRLEVCVCCDGGRKLTLGTPQDVFLPSSTERLRYRDQVTKRYPFA